MTDFANAAPSTVDIVKRESCFQGFYKLDRVHLRHELFAGGMSRESAVNCSCAMTRCACCPTTRSAMKWC